MTEEEWIKQLQKEGYSDIRVVTIEPGDDPEHLHPYDTVNVILSGEVIIIDQSGAKTYRAGDRAETPAGSSHRAENGPTVGKMIVGLRKN